ncbi:hypothetical protein PS673_02068 [Pseudomonas fluorescens]|uniref:DUF6957 domain-containing protein n=1 Tax=Pseudomonas fluorescens TaxID=294 RepID=A0A5E6S8X8_PSEFL|nr:hypothetical protein [Pseudomonas fluorescens]VVM76860.1 hypothetical protein PS673_02068 [Pseudomonas fluorescens]
MTDFSSSSELLSGPGEPLQGSMETVDALIEMAKSRFPRKPYCLIEKWTIFRVDVTEGELNKIHATGQLPLVVFAHNVLFDSQRRFDVGDWVRSTFAISFKAGYLFETRNTIYILVGNGHEKATSLKTALSFF